MSSIEFAATIKPKSRCILEHKGERPFLVNDIQIVCSSTNVFLVEMYKSKEKLFIPWKQKLNALTRLSGQIIDPNVEYRMVFLNDGSKEATLTIRLIGTFSK